MLIILRSLLFAASNAVRRGGSASRKRLRRIARWSEVENLPFVPIAPPKAEDVVVTVEEGIFILTPQIVPGEVVAEVALFNWEIEALNDVLTVLNVMEADEQITALDKATARLPNWNSIEITRSPETEAPMPTA